LELEVAEAEAEPFVQVVVLQNAELVEVAVEEVA
jgi:hypothetical protein